MISSLCPCDSFDLSPRTRFRLWFSKSQCVTRHIIPTLRSLLLLPHNHVYRSLNLDERYRIRIPTVQQPLRFFYPRGFTPAIFTLEVFAYAVPLIFNLGGEWHRPSTIWVPIPCDEYPLVGKSHLECEGILMKDTFRRHPYLLTWILNILRDPLS